MLAVLRFDASPTIGAGHASRCRAIGGALQSYGWRVAAARRAPAGGEVGTIELSGPPAGEPVELAGRFPEGCDLLVVDHYGRDREFERACRPWARRILAIDDLPERRHEANALLDPTPGGTRADYREPPSPATETFLGADYAPLRPSFLRHRHERRGAPPGTIFVGFGGTDPTGLTGRTLKALKQLGILGPVVAVLGRAAPGIAQLRASFGNDTTVRIAVDPPDIAAVMTECEIAIGAGGVSALERCVVGLPSVAVVVAENQRESVAALAKRGAVVAMDDPGDGGFAATLSGALRTLGERRAAIAAAAANVCDGLGAARVAAAVGGAVLRDGSRLFFRPVDSSDLENLLHQPSNLTNQADWLRARLADPARVFEMAYRGGTPAGVVRLDRQPGREGAIYQVSIYVLPGCQGKGVGRALLAFARRAVPWAPLVAEVLPTNEASHRLLLSCGYRNNNGTYVQDPFKEVA